MSADQSQPPAAMRFLDAFLQEQNIKWMLGLGLMILLGSSTMLVTSHWQDCTPLWKSLILFGYTFAIHLLGQTAYHLLHLRKTGTGLMALTVLLIPLDFLATRWISISPSSSLSPLLADVGHVALLSVVGVCSTLSARQILLHFLRKPQRTFLVSYLVLCFSGALLPTLSATWTLPFLLVYWSIFAAGAMKVNRHVFWLAEENRLPRIFGFFPLLLLGMQFFTIYAICLAQNLPVAWLGLGIVLTAIPVLMAVDTLARVIQKRQPDSDAPYPASIAMALIVGLIMTVAGVFISGIGFPEVTALVPTAVLSSCMMVVTGRRTRKPAFIWFAILFGMIAYQTSPVFFKELVIALRNQSAAAIHEERLPLAFYGLTYLPLVSACSLLAWWRGRRQDQVLAGPLGQFSLGLPMALLPVSLTHPKAIFLVGIAVTLYFLWQLWLTRDRQILVAAVLAFLSASAGVPTFLQTISPSLAMKDLPVLTGVVGALLLLMPGRKLDQWAAKLGSELDALNLFSPCQLGSLILTATATACWFPFSQGDMIGVSLAGGMAFLWLTHAMIWRVRLLSEVALIVLMIFAAVLTHRLNWTFLSRMWLAALMATGLSLSSLYLRRVPQWNVAQVFHRSALSTAVYTSVLLLCVLNSSMLITCLHFPFDNIWMVALLSLPVAMELTWRVQSRGMTILCWLTALVLVATVTELHVHWNEPLLWIPLAFTVLSSLGVAMLFRRTRGKSLEEFTRPGNVVLSVLEACVLATLLLVIFASFPAISNPVRLAGAISVAAGIVLTFRRYGHAMWNCMLLLGNGFFLTEVLRWTGDSHALFSGISASQALPLALAAAMSTLFWKRETKRSQLAADVNIIFLEGLAFLAFLLRDKFHLQPLSAVEAGLICSTIGVLVSLHFSKAIQFSGPIENDIKQEHWQHREDHVWWSETLIGVGILQLMWFDLLPLHGTLFLIFPLLLAVISWGISAWASTSPRYDVLHRPLHLTAMILPTVTVGLCLARHFHGSQAEWQGLNSLALLFAAGFYFWQGLEQKRPALQFLAAGILNISTSLLWRELHWSDPQLFLIPLGVSVLVLLELLRNQIPEHLHSPMSYAGALIILISPTFHIVEGSWLHLLSLMVISVLLVLLAMGLRVRALMYTGTAFLIADLISMVIRGSFDHPSLLWLSGIAVGTAVVGLAAYCEQHREQMLQRMRFLAARIELWR